MSAHPSTPRTPSGPAPQAVAAATTPTTTRVSASHAQHLQASPAYTTTRRHSLYGVEDRIVIDPGSHIWKVGFSGEGKPRDVFFTCSKGAIRDRPELWKLARAHDPREREEEERLLAISLERCLRSVFHESLLTAPSSRKVIIVENPLLPLYVKEMIAQVLFDNLQVPSISFASSHLLSLLAVGKITGLVLDCGHLESTALPIFASRPLFPQLRTTPLAGSRFTAHLRDLLLLFGTYRPPPASLSSAVNVPASARSIRVPEDLLTNSLLEDIKTRVCFVGQPLPASASVQLSSGGGSSGNGEDFMDIDAPTSSSSHSAAQSESEFSHLSASDRPMSEFSVVAHPVGTPREGQGGGHGNQMEALANLYVRHSTATTLEVPVPLSDMTTGAGTLVIPGWVRERAAEVLFAGGDLDEASVAEVILDALIKVPVDLRKTLASSILVVGGTPMLPGFIARLHSELLRALSPLPPPPSSSNRSGRSQRRPIHDRYGALRALTPFIRILNNPERGTAPAFTPAMMAWVGGSLAGALKTGGEEIAREKWDEVDPDQLLDDEDEDDAAIIERAQAKERSILPDWTRSPLPVGAPPAVTPAAATQQTQAVGA